MTSQPDVQNKYRKKPVVIEAHQFDGSWTSAQPLLEWIGKNAVWRAVGEDHQLIIRTFEGEHLALAGDWIIKGVKGEFYPCKPDIFEATYEPAAGRGD